jgi:hypothetical protein
MGKAHLLVMDEENLERGPYLVTELAKVSIESHTRSTYHALRGSLPSVEIWVEWVVGRTPEMKQ